MPNYRNAGHGPGSQRIYEVTLQLTADEIELIRAELDRPPFKWIPTCIAKILPALPFTESVAAPPSGPDSSSPLPQVPAVGGGFQLRAHTPYGQVALDALLSRLPHGDSL